MSCESRFRPAGVSPPFFRATLLTPVRFRFAHRAFAAAESKLSPLKIRLFRVLNDPLLGVVSVFFLPRVFAWGSGKSPNQAMQRTRWPAYLCAHTKKYAHPT
jgi:hypothetical protein